VQLACRRPRLILLSPPVWPSLPASANGFQPTVYLQVDLNHDGQFSGTQETQFAVGTLNSQGTASLSVHGLYYGNYQMRVLVYDLAGQAVYSPVQTIGLLPRPRMRLSPIGSNPTWDRSATPRCNMCRATARPPITQAQRGRPRIQRPEDGERARRPVLQSHRPGGGQSQCRRHASQCSHRL